MSYEGNTLDFENALVQLESIIPDISAEFDIIIQRVLDEYNNHLKEDIEGLADRVDELECILNDADML